MEQPKYNIGRIITVLAIVLGVVIFSVQNSSDTEVKIFFWSGQAPLVLLFFMCFLLGLALSLLFIVPMRRYSNKQSRLIGELKTRIDILENQNNHKNDA